MRPGGVLINVLPEPTPLRLQVCVGTRTEEAGWAHDAAFFHKDIAQAHGQLTTLVDQGEFSLLREQHTVMQFTYDTVEGWQSFVTRPRAGTIDANADLLRRGVEAIEQGRGSITSFVENTGRSYRRGWRKV